MVLNHLQQEQSKQCLHPPWEGLRCAWCMQLVPLSTLTQRKLGGEHLPRTFANTPMNGGSFSGACGLWCSARGTMGMVAIPLCLQDHLRVSPGPPAGHSLRVLLCFSSTSHTAEVRLRGGEGGGGLLGVHSLLGLFPLFLPGLAEASSLAESSWLGEHILKWASYPN